MKQTPPQNTEHATPANGSAPAPLTLRRKRSLITRITRTFERGKACYAKADELFTELREGMAVGEIVSTKAGSFAIIDQFANGQNNAYKAARVARFILKEIRPPRGKTKAAQDACNEPATASQES